LLRRRDSSDKAGVSYVPAGYGNGPIYYDAYRSRRAPSLPELVEAYKAICYSCANFNANGVARVPLRLYAASEAGMARPKGRDWGGCHPLRKTSEGRRREKWLRASRFSPNLVRKAEEIDEVVEHPLLEAMHEVNPDFDHNALIRYTALCLDVVGAAYWWPEAQGQRVSSIWPLQAQYVKPVFLAGESAVHEYVYFAHHYQPAELVRIRHVSLRDPHGFGYGPTQAAFAYVGLSDQFVSVQENLMGQGFRPSAVIRPKEANMPMGKDERRRLQTEMDAQWTGPRAGRVFIADAALDVDTLSWPPSDLAALEISDNALQRIANCFGVPISLLKTEDVNLANAEAGHRQHAELAIEPRCVLIASAITTWLHGVENVERLGWDRLFFAFDNPVAEDAEREAKIFDMKLKNGSLTINEVRLEEGYDSVPYGDLPWFPQTLVQPDQQQGMRDEPRADFRPRPSSL
jgi:HK97 family phage portal protein